MRTKLKNRLTVILILLSFLIVSAVSVTIIFALTQQNISTEVGVEFFPSTTPVEAFTFSDNGNGTYSVSDFDSTYSGSVIIPETYKGSPVMRIGDNAFKGCRNVTSVTIPDSINSIGTYAFANCQGATKIIIGKGVTSIGQFAFQGCSGLTNITVDSDNTKYRSIDNCLIETESQTLIQGCKSSIIPTDGSVNIIGNRAFMRSDLTSITIPDTITTIEDYAFYECSELSSIEIPNSVTSIGVNVFVYCRGLNNVKIGRGVTSIDSQAFSGCVSLKNVTIDTINTNVLATVKNLANVNGTINLTIGSSVSSISDSAFSSWTGLTSITIPDSVENIGDNAFFNCSNLTSVTIPDSVTSIGMGAFSDCARLTSVTFENTNGWFLASDENATSGTDLSSADLSNTSTAANYLRLTYVANYWKRV